MPLSGGDKTLNQTSWLSPFVMQDLKYDGFAFLCFKCAHALLKKTMEGFFFSSSVTTPSLLVQLISQLSRVVITEIPRALFSGACQIISTMSTLNASQPNSFSPLSALQSSACLWGLVLACGLAAPAGSPSGTSSTPPPLPSPHMPVCYVHAGVISGGPLAL